MEQAQDTQPRKRSGAPITILIAVVAFLVGIGLYALLSATVFKPTATSNGDKKDQTTEQSTALSYDTYKDLARRANILLYGVNISDTFLIGYQPIVTLNDLTKLPADNKTSSAYFYSNVGLPTDKLQKATDAEADALCEALGAKPENCRGQTSIIRDYDMTKIQEAYKKFFGEELDLSAKSILLTMYLNPLVYVPSQKALYTDFAAGGDIATESYNYISNISIEDDKAYVNFSFIISDYPLGDYNLGISDMSKLICYDNFKRIAAKDCANYFGTGVNEFNYKNLKNYRLVFEKDNDGNFVYKTAEEVK